MTLEWEESLKSYKGFRGPDGGAMVVVEIPDVYGGDPKHESLKPRTDLRNHSPTGFEWGYQGSGPAQLALAILADFFGDKVAEMGHQRFKRDVIAQLPRSKPWEIDYQVMKNWLKALINAPSQLEIAIAEETGMVEILKDKRESETPS